MAMRQAEEAAENKEIHRKIVELSNMMAYDDDIDESRLKTLQAQ